MQSNDAQGGLRAFINEHARLALAIVGLILILTVGFAVVQSQKVSHPSTHNPVAYYTSDDGATLFQGDAGTLPPFDHDGKEAVRAYCFPDTGGKRTVWYLEKWTEEGKRVMAAPTAGSTADLRLVKLPGASEWLRSSSPEAQ